MKKIALIQLTALCFLFGLNAFFTSALAADTKADINAATPTGFPISLNSMVLFALHENPDINILKSREDQARHSIKEKQADLYPELDLDITAGREYNDPTAGSTTGGSGTNNTSSMTLTLSQLIFDGFKTDYEIKNRQKLMQASEFKTKAAVEEIITNTVDNYLKALRYQEDIRNLQNLIVSVTHTVGVIQELFQAGATGKVMLDYANSRLTFATTELNRAQSSLNDAKSNLEFLVGKLPPDFMALPPEELMPNKLSMAYYIKNLQEKNHTVLSSQSEIEAMQDALHAQKSKYMPEINLDIKANQTNNNGGDIGTERELSAKFRLSYPLFDGGKRKAGSARIYSQIKELDYKKQQVLKELQRSVKLAYNQIDANKTALSLTESEILSNIAQTKLNEENFRLGNINVIELIESNERLKDAYLKKNKLNYDMHLNAYSLLILTNILEKDYFCETCLLADDPT